jgi:hypothetical protein
MNHPDPEHTSLVMQGDVMASPRVQSWLTGTEGRALGEAVAVEVGTIGAGDALVPPGRGTGVSDALRAHLAPVQSHVTQEPRLGPVLDPTPHTDVSMHHPHEGWVVQEEQLWGGVGVGVVCGWERVGGQ